MKKTDEFINIITADISATGAIYYNSSEIVARIGQDVKYICAHSDYYDDEMDLDMSLRQIPKFDIRKEFIRILKSFYDKRDKFGCMADRIYSVFETQPTAEGKLFYLMISEEEINYQDISITMKINMDIPEVLNSKDFIKLLNDIEETGQKGIAICTDKEVIEIKATK